MVTVVDVVSSILERCGALTTMKMQKLAFYCQAQSLASGGGFLHGIWVGGQPVGKPVCAGWLRV